MPDTATQGSQNYQCLPLSHRRRFAWIWLLSVYRAAHYVNFYGIMVYNRNYY